MKKSCGLLCPTCRAPMTSSVYERALDHLLESLVNGLPEAEVELHALQVEWRKRRRAYHDQMLTFACSLPKPSLGRGQPLGEEEDGDDDGGEDEAGWAQFYENAEGCILPILFAVIALIMVCRSRH